MKTQRLQTLMQGLILAIFLATAVNAADKKAMGKMEMTPEMQAQMAKMKEMGTPGAEHAVFNDVVGKWKVTSKSWMKPGAPEEKSEGTSTMSWVLGGRFIKQEFKGNWAGQKFEGMGFCGYDKVKKEYNSIWMDDMMTGIFKSTGQYDAATKTIKESGSASCPMTGEQDKWFRSEFKIGKDELTYTMWAKDEAGKEFMTMAMTYTRMNKKK